MLASELCGDVDVLEGGGVGGDLGGELDGVFAAELGSGAAPGAALLNPLNLFFVQVFRSSIEGFSSVQKR